MTLCDPKKHPPFVTGDANGFETGVPPIPVDSHHLPHLNCYLGIYPCMCIYMYIYHIYTHIYNIYTPIYIYISNIYIYTHIPQFSDGDPIFGTPGAPTFQRSQDQSGQCSTSAEKTNHQAAHDSIFSLIVGKTMVNSG